MSLTAEQIARRGCAELFDPNRVTVRVKVSWRGNFCIPDPEGDKEEVAVFATMLLGDHQIISKATTSEVEIGRKAYGSKVTTLVSDVHEVRRLTLKRNLLSWSLDIPIERDETGWMTDACYERVSRVFAPLVAAFLDEFEKSIEITEDEEQKINKQCAILFSKTSQGVVDACDAISQFCLLGNFSEKFGINRDMLPYIPYKDFLLLKIVVGKESDAMRVNSAPKGSGQSKIVGAGGRSRASRATVIPLPGSGG